MNKWHSRVFCIVCGWSKPAHGSLFLSQPPDCCPDCGTTKETSGLSPIWGEPFIIKTVRWVSTSKLWNPKTWGNGDWEEREE